MDEGGMSTLASLGQFTTVDIVRGIIAPGEGGGGNYLVRVVRVLGT